VILAELRGPLSPVALGWPNVGSSSALTMRTRDLARRAHVAAASAPLVALLAKISAGQPVDGVGAAKRRGCEAETTRVQLRNWRVTAEASSPMARVVREWQ